MMFFSILDSCLNVYITHDTGTDSEVIHLPGWPFITFHWRLWILEAARQVRASSGKISAHMEIGDASRAQDLFKFSELFIANLESMLNAKAHARVFDVDDHEQETREDILGETTGDGSHKCAEDARICFL